jgi:sulfatase modifying factor 1
MSCCTPQRDSGKKGQPLDFGIRAKIQGLTPSDLSGMIRLEGGTFLMGSADEDGWPEDGEGPVREVALSAFYLDATAVTNVQFAKFVEATDYQTEAERFGWSFVFHLLVPAKILRKLGRSKRVEGLNWWVGVEGASWKKPEGPGSNIKKRMDHPVVHVSWHDAKHYADWAGKRLPTEAEWEFAGRGGLVQQRYCWGNELTPNGKHMCNIWQGDFPNQNSAEDGYVGTAPARSFLKNGYGFYNMAGNVWEWCADWFSPIWHVPERSETRVNPKGPDTGYDIGKGGGPGRVMRGGSYLCHDSYCNRYRVGARTSNTPDSSTGNCGFRCAADVS